MKTLIEVLMVEDNRGDVILTEEAIIQARLPYRVHVVRDGSDAMVFVRRQGPFADAPRPDLIVLDLRLPRKGGREVLEELRSDPLWQTIPLVIVSSSRSELALAGPHALPSQCSMTKPSTFAGYVELVQAIEAFRQRVRAANEGDTKT